MLRATYAQLSLNYRAYGQNETLKVIKSKLVVYKENVKIAQKLFQLH